MDRIVTIEGVRGGRPVIAGTRITVSEVLEMLGAGMTEADIREAFPNIASEDIRAALAYAAREFDHPVVSAPLSAN
ncbi:MAG TPA: DUF433 domain-containing protein [Caulobacterales bacterium]|jgi:uncharacterized protein (DUF433 family)|nr:DUF433 domain-containing protein [Caulobacterales bacterium]